MGEQFSRALQGARAAMAQAGQKPQGPQGPPGAKPPGQPQKAPSENVRITVPAGLFRDMMGPKTPTGPPQGGMDPARLAAMKAQMAQRSPVI